MTKPLTSADWEYKAVWAHEDHVRFRALYESPTRRQKQQIDDALSRYAECVVKAGMGWDVLRLLANELGALVMPQDCDAPHSPSIALPDSAAWSKNYGHG